MIVDASSHPAKLSKWLRLQVGQLAPSTLDRLLNQDMCLTKSVEIADAVCQYLPTQTIEGTLSQPGKQSMVKGEIKHLICKSAS